MQNRNSRRITFAIGGVMLFAMIASVFAPLIRPNVPIASDVEPPTPLPSQTPPPPPDVNTIVFNQTYMHPSALFTVDYPAPWIPSGATNNGTQAQINMTNQSALSVLEAYIEVPLEPVMTLDELSARFPTNVLQQSWRRYTSSTETARRQENDRLIIDFELQLGQQPLLARQITWTDGEWIYVVRAVVPQNARDVLLYLLDNMVPTLKPVKEFASTPTIWHAYYDIQDKHIIRYPAEWTLSDSAPGSPASVEFGGIVLRLEAQGGSVADEAAASAWVQAARPGAAILSTVPVERDGHSGFAVSYSFTDVEGEAFSGLAVLLNDSGAKLHIANLRFMGQGIDLNALSDEQTAAFGSLAAVMNTFTIRSDLTVTDFGKFEA